jgi:DNA polymerase III subunit gamma/tau
MTETTRSQALYRKWRPQTWDEIIGQEHVVQTLHNALAAGRIVHAYLFAGPRGTGKTSAARLLAKAVNCLEEDLSRRPCGRERDAQCEYCRAVNEGRFLDLIEIDAASNTSVEDVRDLRDKINFAPNQGRYKVYIIDEVHMLSTAAFNALLKTLEEPPPHAIFVLATTEVHKIPATVLSRCQRHEFRRIPVVSIVEHLRTLALGESIQVDEQALQAIARQSTGAMRDAISLLDQLSSTGQAITLELVQEMLGTAANQAVLDLVSALAEAGEPGKVADGLDLIHATLDAGSDPRQFARQVVEYLRGILLIQAKNASAVDATAEVRAQMAQHARQFHSAELLQIVRLFNDATSVSRSGWQPALPLELAFLEASNAHIDPQKALSSASNQPSFSGDPGASHPGLDQSMGDEAQSGASRLGTVRIATPAPPDPRRAESQAARRPEEESRPADNRNDSDILFSKVVEHWRKILYDVGLVSRQTQALLNSCKPFGVKDGVLFLGFNGDFAKNKMEKGDNVTVTCQVLENVLGEKVPLRCFIAAGGKSSLPSDIESDGMVATVLRDLGGEVVDIQ